MKKDGKEYDPYRKKTSLPPGMIFVEVVAAIAIGVVLFYMNVISIFTDIQDLFKNILPSLLMVILILIATKLILDIVRRPFEHAASLYMKSHADIKMAWSIISYTVWFLLLFIFLFYLFSEFLVALLGLALIIGAVIYVLGRPITNFAGWFAIVARRPFKIGDRIAIKGASGAVNGYVVEITLMNIVLREFKGWMKGDTFTGRLLYVPNNAIFESNFYNYDKYAPFIYDEVTVSITYESDHELAERLIQKAAFEVVGAEMKRHFPKFTKILEIKDLTSQMTHKPRTMLDFRPSSVDVSVVYFCRTNLRRKVKSDITRKILGKFRQTDRVHIAYPHVEVVGVGEGNQ